jgi:hypothetical protein
VGQGVVDLGRAEDPEVHGAAALFGGVLQRRLDQGDFHADAPVLGVDHDLQTPVGWRAIAFGGEVGVPDGVGVGRVLGDEAGEAGAPAVDEIEPLVLAQCLVVVEAADSFEQVAYFGQIGLADITNHAHFDHQTAG